MDPEKRLALRGERGFALIIVLLVLLALLVLCTPFLLTARSADKASAQLADRSEAELALDSAGRHVRRGLSDSHPSTDKTPYWDSAEEIAISNRMDPSFCNPNDPKGLMWDLDLTDIAGKIDLNSCSPHVIANLLNLTTRFAAPIAADEKKLDLSSVSHLEPAGFVWSEGELILYSKIEETSLVKFQRGLLAPANETDWRGGPRPTCVHGAGAPVIDQRAFAPILWRLNTASGQVKKLEEIGRAHV